MINNKKVVALITARGGSKRLPGKNILDLSGKPMISWTIDAAINSQFVDRVVVSTDDMEIARLSEYYGAEVPFMRPSNLSSDTSTSNDVLLHAIEALDLTNEIIVLLQPTSPLRLSSHIDDSLELLLDKNAEGVVSVTECEHSPLWSNQLPDSGCMNEFILPSNMKRSQDLAPYYRINGAIYSFTVKSLLNNKGIYYGESVFSYIMPLEYSVDVDCEYDFDFASFLLNKRNS